MAVDPLAQRRNQLLEQRPFHARVFRYETGAQLHGNGRDDRVLAGGVGVGLRELQSFVVEGGERLPGGVQGAPEPCFDGGIGRLFLPEVVQRPVVVFVAERRRATSPRRLPLLWSRPRRSYPRRG